MLLIIRVWIIRSNFLLLRQFSDDDVKGDRYSYTRFAYVYVLWFNEEENDQSNDTDEFYIYIYIYKYN